MPKHCSDVVTRMAHEYSFSLRTAANTQESDE